MSRKDVEPAKPNAGQRSISRRREPEPIIITDGWPEVVPVTSAEVLIIEAYLEPLLDELFDSFP